MKALLLVFREITNQVQQEKKWKVRWIIEDEDEFMADAAESFEQLLNIEFEIVAIKN
jgi:hypothetical protein